MASTLPSARDLGVVSVQPSLGVAQRQGATGYEDAVAKGITTAGDRFAAAGHLLDQAQDEHARMMAEDALNKVRAEFIKQQFDEKDGWATKKGEAAVNPDFIKSKLEAFNGAVEKIGGTLSDRSKKYFRPQAEASRLHSESAFYGHVAEQRVQHDMNIFNAGRQLVLDRVARTAVGPLGDTEMDSAIAELRYKSEAFGLRRGLSPEEATALANANITDVVITRVKGALAMNRPDEAKRIFEDNAKLLGQKGLDALQKPVTDAYRDWKVLNVADEEVRKTVQTIEAATRAIPPGGVGDTTPKPSETGAQPAWPVRAESTVTPEQQREGRGRRQDVTQMLPDPLRVYVPPSVDAAVAQVSAGDLEKQTWLRAILTTENAGFGEVRSDKVSPMGAAGPFQFMRATGLEYGLSPEDRADPVKSAVAASKFYDWLRHKYQGNRAAMAAHYNGGTLAGEAVMRGAAPPAAETRNYLAMFARADAGGGEGATGGFFPGGFKTSRVRMIQERQGEILDATRARLEREFPNDPQAVQHGLQRAQALIGMQINAENGIQQANLNTITTAILNSGVDNLRDLLAIPGMPDKLSTAGPYMQSIVSLMNLVQHQKNGEKDFKGNPTLHYSLAQRVLNGEIKSDNDLLPYLGDPTRSGSGLSMPQFHDLQTQLARKDRAENRDGERNLTAMQPSAHGSIRNYLASNGLYQGTPGFDAVLGDSFSQWTIRARQDIARAEASKDPRKAFEALFDPRSPSYLASPARIKEVVELSRRTAAPESMVVPATSDEVAGAPVIKNKNRDKDPVWQKTEPAVLTAAGWRGGWVKDSTGKLVQKRPKSLNPNLEDLGG